MLLLLLFVEVLVEKVGWVWVVLKGLQKLVQELFFVLVVVVLIVWHDPGVYVAGFIILFHDNILHHYPTLKIQT